LDTRLRDQAQERRLSKLHRQSLAKRPVKYGVARRVHEIGEDNRVFVREFWRPMKIEVTCGGQRQHSRGSRNNRLRAFGDVTRARLQALKVDANFRGMLVAQLTVVLQAFRKDGLELRWRCV